MNRSEIKSVAKQQIKGKIGILFVISLLYSLICFAASFISGFVPVLGAWALFIFVSAPLSLSFCIIYLDVTKGVEPMVKDLFSGYSNFWGAFKVSFFTGLFVLLWSFLLIIPGIIKGIAYSMSMYILAENEGMGALEAIARSEEMMRGHKLDYFVLGLSFIGWWLLVALTFGIAGIWVFPYQQVTYANFYNKIKASSSPFTAEADKAD